MPPPARCFISPRHDAHACLFRCRRCCFRCFIRYLRCSYALRLMLFAPCHAASPVADATIAATSAAATMLISRYAGLIYARCLPLFPSCCRQPLRHAYRLICYAPLLLPHTSRCCCFMMMSVYCFDFSPLLLAHATLPPFTQPLRYADAMITLRSIL